MRVFRFIADNKEHGYHFSFVLTVLIFCIRLTSPFSKSFKMGKTSTTTTAQQTKYPAKAI